MADSFSPELALVDPDLASALRTSLPEPDDCLAGSPEASTEPAPVVAPPEERRAPAILVPVAARPAPVPPSRSQSAAVRESPPSRRGRRGIRGWAIGLVVLGILAFPFLAFLSPDSPNDPVRTLGEGAGAGGVAGRTADEAAGGRDRLLEWPVVRGANLYNVVFVTGKNRVDRWVKGTSTTLPRAAESDARPLVVYRWYVYPLYRKQQGVRFGKLIAQGRIRLPKGSFER